MEIDEVKSLFYKYNQKYFDGKLHKVRLEWSDRMTLCAGKTYFKTRGSWKACDIRLSKPLLSLRPSSDTVNTLLHEMIHAYLNLTMGTTLRESHGPEFRKHMNRINSAEKTKITVYHSFHKEVDKYRIHIYRCDGPCRSKKPYFGIIKRAIERPPGPEDHWWSKHSEECWGTFIKISGPGTVKETGESKKTTKQDEEPGDYALSVKHLHTGSKLHVMSDCDNNKEDFNVKTKLLDAGQEKKREDEIVGKIKAKYGNQKTTILLSQKSKEWNHSSSCKSSDNLELGERYTSSSGSTMDSQKLVDGKLNPNYQCRTPKKIKIAKYLAKYQLTVEGKETSHIHTSPDMKMVNGSVVWNYEQRTPSKILAAKYIERFKNAIKKELEDSSDLDKTYIITPSGHVVYNESNQTNESLSAEEEPEPPEAETSRSGKKKKKAVKQSNLITRYLIQPDSSPSSQSVPSSGDDFMVSLTPSIEMRKAKRKLYEDDSPDKSSYRIPKLSEGSNCNETDGRQREATCTNTGLQDKTSAMPSNSAEHLSNICRKNLYSDLSGERKDKKLTNKAKASDFKDEQQTLHVDSRMDTKSESSSSSHQTKKATTDCTKNVFMKYDPECMDKEERGNEIPQNTSNVKKECPKSSSVPLLKKSDSIDYSKTECVVCGKTVSIHTYQEHLAQCMWDDDLTQEICSDSKDTVKSGPCDSGKKINIDDSIRNEVNDKGTEKMGILEEVWDGGRSTPKDVFRNEILSGSDGDSMNKSKDCVSTGIGQSDLHNRYKGDREDITSSNECITSTGSNNSHAKSRKINNVQQPGCSKWYSSEKCISKNEEEIDLDKSLLCHICCNEIIAAELDEHLKYCDIDDDFCKKPAEVSDEDSDDAVFSQKDHTGVRDIHSESYGSCSPIMCPVCSERMDPEHLEEHIKLCVSFMSEDDDHV